MAEKLIRVWDPFVRLFHWALVGSFSVAYFTELDVLTLHPYAGYLIFALLLFRIAWGFWGSRHARFSDFMRSPAAVTAYLRALGNGSAKRHVGHNPAGGAMILALLSVLALTVLSGFALYGLEGNQGPLAFLHGSLPTRVDDWVEEIHSLLSHLTALLILVHLAGVVWSSVLHRENLPKAMMTGRKPE